MFTGLVETLGKIKALRPSRAGIELVIDIGRLAEDAKLGDSIAVNGACLTVSQLSGTTATFDVMGETMRASTLEQLKTSQDVNLERALKFGDRLGGHLVQGHVDGVGTIEQVEKKPTQHTIWIGTTDDVLKLMVPKGSVAIDGVSLTVVEVQPNRFSVWLIPTTLEDTTLNQRKPGDRVNLETDLIGKWINQRLDAVLGRGGSAVTMEKLRQQGFA